MGCEALAIPSRAVAATDAFKKQVGCVMLQPLHVWVLLTPASSIQASCPFRLFLPTHVPCTAVRLRPAPQPCHFPNISLSPLSHHLLLRPLHLTHLHTLPTPSSRPSQSVTSERWLRLLEVAPPDVPAFLAERKAAGYAVVGE